MTFNLGDMTLTMGIVHAAVFKVLMPLWPDCVCGLPMRRRCAWAWNFVSVTYDIGDVTLTSGFMNVHAAVSKALMPLCFSC